MSQTYTVQGGDTLYRIAQKFGVTVVALTAANNLANPNLIKPGQVLTIPALGSAVSAPAPAAPPTTAPVVPPMPAKPILPSVPDWYTPLPPATRPASALPLNKFPRPANDNGRGIHFGLNVRDRDLDAWIPRAVELGIKWILFYVQDEIQSELCAVAAWNAGIMPIIRVGKHIDVAGIDYPTYVKRITAHGIPAYIQLYNEPGDDREWNGQHAPRNAADRFGPIWGNAAAQVYNAGGYPGLQILGIEEFTSAVNAVKAAGRTDIWDRAFFSLHNYGLNHPPAYPYDDVNQKEHPKATILEDDSCVLNAIEYAQWMYDQIGFVLPIIGGEGGWIYGSAEDNRYPKTNQPYHAQWHVEMYDWFRKGVLSNGQPLPDYLFSVAPWILSGIVEAEAWYGGPLGDKTDTINAVKQMPPFVRKFSWDG